MPVNISALRSKAASVNSGNYEIIMPMLHMQADEDIAQKEPITITGDRVVFGPGFSGLPEEKQIALWLSATMHFMFEDGEILARLPKEGHDAARLACDMFNHSLLEASGYRLPNDFPTLKQFFGSIKEPFDDTTLGKVTKMQVLDLIRRQQQKQPQPQGGGQCNNPGQGGGRGNSPAAGSGQGNSPTHGDLQSSDEMPQDQRDSVSSSANSARASIGTGQGTMAQAFRRLGFVAGAKDFDPEKVLASFLVRTTKSSRKPDWSRGSRRWSALCQRTPVVFEPARLPEKNARIGLIFDTSGSISAAMIGTMLGMLNKILKTMPCEVQVIAADAAVHEVYNFKPKDAVIITQKKYSGGGGTDFRPALKKVEEFKPHAVIYITDMYGTFPTKAPSFPILWATNQGAPSAPYGQTIEIKL